MNQLLTPKGMGEEEKKHGVFIEKNVMKEITGRSYDLKVPVNQDCIGNIRRAKQENRRIMAEIMLPSGIAIAVDCRILSEIH